MSKLACIVVSTFSLAACATFNEANKRTLISSIDHSEWGDPSQLRVDLDTGAYSIVYGLDYKSGSRGRSRGRPLYRTLNAKDLDGLNAMVAKAQISGLTDEQCAATPRGERGYFKISNGGTPQLSLMLNGSKSASFDDWECWTDEASQLHDHLLDLFDKERGLDLN